MPQKFKKKKTSTFKKKSWLLGAVVVDVEESMGGQMVMGKNKEKKDSIWTCVNKAIFACDIKKILKTS